MTLSHSLILLLLTASIAQAIETAAKVENPVPEASLTTLTLTSKATERLGITTIAVEKKSMPRVRVYPGEIIFPMVAPGAKVPPLAPPPTTSSADLLKLAEAQALADGDIQKAKVQMDAAKIAVDRAQKLVAAQSGSERSVDEAKAQFDTAKAALDNAETRRALFGAPIGASLDRVWVRVPVFNGDLPLIAKDKAALIADLGARSGSPTKTVKPVAAPPSANALASTVDLFFDLENTDQSLRPGQRVGATLALTGESETLVIPWAAVLHDINGNQWVYENTAPDKFIRRRVEVTRVSGADAAIASGPAVGAKIVTNGAAELFGTEFGAK